jgi:alpha-1,3-rhamnosyl/mannosyltransferase
MVLLDAMARLPDVHADTMLVLTGGSARMERRLVERVAELEIGRNVLRTGRIPRADLDALYRGAVALVFPSRFEGFGLPVLEAMARDCPVVAADATALPEVVDEAGLLVEPGDADAWAAAIVSLLGDDALRSHLVDAGRRRAAHYAWETAAAELERLYLDVLESRS